MSVDSDRLKQLIAKYGEQQGYPEKSYIPQFCKDFDLNYNQWNAYTRGQNIGITIIHKLIDIFPLLNLNWLLKGEGEMFLNQDMMVVSEPDAKYSQEIVDDLYRKVKNYTQKLNEINKLSRI